MSAATQATKATATQFARYLVVGGINTVVTLLCIFVLKSLLGVNPYVANAAGYVAGIINAFIWNRTWVFRSNGQRTAEALRFVIGFAACYLMQLLCVWSLSTFTPLADTLCHISTPFIHKSVTISGYGIATIIGMAVYTAANYIYNRTVTFR